MPLFNDHRAGTARDCKLTRASQGRLALIIDNKHYINAFKLHSHLLVLDGIYVTICWTSDDCDGQVDLKLHLSVRQVILIPYFDHCAVMTCQKKTCM